MIEDIRSVLSRLDRRAAGDAAGVLALFAVLALALHLPLPV